MRYHELKKLVFCGVYIKNVIEICAHLQAECRIKHAWYSLIIMVIQKCVKRRLICFARDRVYAISIAWIGLQVQYHELKKLVFSGVYFKDVIEIYTHLQAECRIKHARYSLIIIVIQKCVKRRLICFTRDRVYAVSIAWIGLQMQYHEPKKLVFSSVYFKNVIEICAHLQAECRIKHTQYSLIIMIIQKYVKRMPICFTRDHVCTISIACIGLQMRYHEPKKLVFNGV